MQWTAADINHLYLTESVDEPEEKRRTFPIRHDGSCRVCWKSQGPMSGPFTAVRVREVQTPLCSDCDVIMRELEERPLAAAVSRRETMPAEYRRVRAGQQLSKLEAVVYNMR